MILEEIEVPGQAEILRAYLAAMESVAGLIESQKEIVKALQLMSFSIQMIEKNLSDIVRDR